MQLIRGKTKTKKSIPFRMLMAVKRKTIENKGMRINWKDFIKGIYLR
jgi:hypothetical protein